MAEAPGLSDSRVAILGLGLIGGSLALALRGHCARLLGSDRDRTVVAMAEKMGLLDQAHMDPAAILPEADLVVLAAPVRSNIELLLQLPARHPGEAIVLDVSSTKSDVVRAMEALPSRFDPVGGHPMCGKERGGLSSAEAGLFRGAPFALVALPRSSGRARALAYEVVLALGALPLWLDAETHDRRVAATSHLPFLLAAALALATPEEAAQLVGPGLLSATRLAVSDSTMMLDVLATNRGNMLAALRRFQGQLAALEGLLELEDFTALRAALEEAAAKRKILTARGREGYVR